MDGWVGELVNRYVGGCMWVGGWGSWSVFGCLKKWLVKYWVSNGSGKVALGAGFGNAWFGE